ncbi:hypothetical protein [Methanolobus bombayensis]|uniref:hypothetical protein n=1 Tax=Methanolobus bombayensis TaxID=38023 RepID=UPI001AE431A2|nr:hypothetical protein [Methanolobus bombayensis]MBP1909901.1 putative nucleic acid-binding Zn-ribbon protein [Methanolobus bombayensis]
MNNDTVDQGASNNAPHTYDRKELIEGVVQKHKKYIAEYTAEFNELDNKMKELQENIDTSNKNKVEAQEKIEILAEKRQLFYHQAEKLLDELVDSASDSDISREVTQIKERLGKVKGSLAPEDEQKQVDEIVQNITSLGSKVSGIEDRLANISNRIKDAINSKIELSSIDSSEEVYSDKVSSSEENIKEIEPRYKWLENRIKSHQDALEYWEKQPLESDKQGAEA